MYACIVCVCTYTHTYRGVVQTCTTEHVHILYSGDMKFHEQDPETDGAFTHLENNPLNCLGKSCHSPMAWQESQMVAFPPLADFPATYLSPPPRNAGGATPLPLWVLPLWCLAGTRILS
ncbi:UNVERIFIED_CONTAM: hypothetical protein K2H54_074044 [Gekko kuhli]